MLCILGSSALARWVLHKDFQVFQDVIAYIKAARPRSGLLENVTGMAAKSGLGEDVTPMEFIKEQLKEANYFVDVVFINNSLFVDVTRQRCIASAARETKNDASRCKTQEACFSCSANCYSYAERSLLSRP